MRTTYVQVKGVLYLKGTEPQEALGSSPMIARDLPDFVSPIDRTVVRGRAGIREHCAKHNVVPTAELDGLPTRMPYTPPNKQEIRETVLEIIHRKNYLKEQL